METVKISQRGNPALVSQIHQVYFGTWGADGKRVGIEVLNTKTIKGARLAAEKFAKKYAKENGFKKYKFVF